MITATAHGDAQHSNVCVPALPCAAHRRRKRPPWCCSSTAAIRTHRAGAAALAKSGGRRWRSFQLGTSLQQRRPGCELVVVEDGRSPMTTSIVTTGPYVLAASHQASCSPVRGTNLVLRRRVSCSRCRSALLMPLIPQRSSSQRAAALTGRRPAIAAILKTWPSHVMAQQRARVRLQQSCLWCRRESSGLPAPQLAV